MKIATQTFPYLSVHVPSSNDTPKKHKEVRVPLHTMTCVHFTLPTPPKKKKKLQLVFLFETLQRKVYFPCDAIIWQPYAALGSRQFSQECDLEDHHSITSWCYQVVGNFHWIFSASDLALKNPALWGCWAAWIKNTTNAPPSSLSLWMSLMQVLATHPSPAWVGSSWTEVSNQSLAFYWNVARC